MDVFQATPRRWFTMEEVEQMLRTGLLRGDESVELVEGQLLVMTPRDDHVDVATALGRRRVAPGDLKHPARVAPREDLPAAGAASRGGGIRTRDLLLPKQAR